MTTASDMAFTNQGRQMRGWRTLFWLFYVGGVLGTWYSVRLDWLIGVSLLIAIARLSPDYVAAVAVMGVLMPVVNGVMTYAYIDYIRWMTVFGCALFLFARFSRGALGRKMQWLTVFRSMMWCFVAAALLSTISSSSSFLAISKCIPLIAMLLSCAIVSEAVVLQFGVWSAGAMTRRWVLLMLPIVVLNWVCYLRGTSPSGHYPYIESAFRGIAGNPNGLGVVSAMALPFAFAVIAAWRQRWNRWMFAFTLAAASCVALLAMTRSRASALAFACGMAVMWILHPRTKLSQLAVLAAIAGSLLIATQPAATVERVRDWVYKGHDESGVLRSRLAPWEEARDMFMQSPLVGTGYGVTNYSEDFRVRSSAMRGVRTEIGSSFWAVLSQVGLAGSVPMGLAFLAILLKAFPFAYQVRDPYFSAMLASACAGLVNSMFEGWMMSPGNGILWLFLIQLFLMDSIMMRFVPPHAVAPDFALPRAIPRFNVPMAQERPALRR